MHRQTVLLCLVAVCTVAAASVASVDAALTDTRSSRDEANLVVSRFLVASALGDRRTACELYPTYDYCLRGKPFVGPAHFRVLAIAVRRHGAVVSVSVGHGRGIFVLERVGDSFAILTAPTAFLTSGKPHRAAADLVVTRFLVAAARRPPDRLRALPSYFPCSRDGRVVGSADFQIVSTSLVDPARPAVFANVDGLCGYFVLERRRGSFRVVGAELD